MIFTNTESTSSSPTIRGLSTLLKYYRDMLYRDCEPSILNDFNEWFEWAMALHTDKPLPVYQAEKMTRDFFRYQVKAFVQASQPFRVRFDALPMVSDSRKIITTLNY